MDHGRQKTGEKFSTYFELRDACRNNGCPICRLLRKAEHRYLENLLYERVNDPPTRLALRESLGLCREHSFKFLSMGDAFGVAIIYEDLLQATVKRLDEEELPQASAECPVCTNRQQSERRYVETANRHLDDHEFQQVLHASDGVCLPHLRLITVKLQGDRKKFLLAAQKQVLDRRIAQLNEFIRKHDYRFSREKITEEEASSRRRAIHFLVGE